MTVLVGADWDRDKCVVELLVDGKRVSAANVRRKPESVNAFIARFPKQTVRVAIEAGDASWPAMWQRAGAEVVVFDCKKSRRFGESLNSGGSSDDRHSAKDLLAMLLSEAHCQASNGELSPKAKALSRLMGLREHCSNETVRHRNRLRAELRQYHPAVEQMLSSLKTAWILRLLSVAPTAKAWNELSEAEQLRLLKGSSQAKREQYFKTFGEDWGVVPEELEEAARTAIRVTVSVLQAALSACAEAEKQLERHVEDHPTASTIGSIKGLGTVLSAGIAVALDQDSDSSGRDAAAKRLGVAPVTCRSGTFGDKAPLVKIRRSTNQLMRKLGHFIAVQLVANYAWAKAAYSYHRAHGKSGFASYRCITRSFLRVIVALLRDGVEFDEYRYVKALKSHGVPWAKALAIEEAA